MTRPNGDLIGPPRGALTIALAGNPNCGRSALFNALTGIRQKTGNWPGVTVERRLGHCRLDGREIEVVDLPGIYSFDAASLDEQVTRDYLLTREADLIVNVLDAGNLERNLYLTVQLLEMGVPLVIASAATCRRSWRRAHWQNARERKLTILMNPFMSCGARLPVYALFAAAFFPDAGQNVVFALYLVGIAVAILTGLMMKKSLLPGSSSGFMMELPPYHLPTLRAVLLRDAAATVPANLAELSRSVLDPLGLGEVRVADASAYGVDRAVFGEMHARFDGQVGAFAYLLFVLLYFPCVATIAVIRRETGGTRAAFVAAWSTLCRLPDGHGVLPGRDLQRPPAQLAGLLGLLALVVAGLRRWARRGGRRPDAWEWAGS